MSQLELDYQLAIDAADLPSQSDCSAWIVTALEAADYSSDKPVAITVRIVGLEESQTLNGEYRGKNKPTNVLSFPAETPEFLQEELPEQLLGDLVICAPVVAQEASEQGKKLIAHWAHMLVHGTLHLLGFDHIVDHEAEEMESLEIRILQQLGYADPYQA